MQVVTTRKSCYNNRMYIAQLFHPVTQKPIQTVKMRVWGWSQSDTYQYQREGYYVNTESQLFLLESQLNDIDWRKSK